MNVVPGSRIGSSDYPYPRRFPSAESIIDPARTPEGDIQTPTGVVPDGTPLDRGHHPHSHAEAQAQAEAEEWSPDEWREWSEDPGNYRPEEEGPNRSRWWDGVDGSGPRRVPNTPDGVGPIERPTTPSEAE